MAGIAGPGHRKGLLMAGGKGTRLYPMTNVASKQLLPIYNKPMIYYPLTTLLLLGVREILLISSPEDAPRSEHLLGDGRRWGIRLTYQVQESPRGIAEGLVLGESFVGDDPVVVMLGDNLIYGQLDFVRAAIEQNGDGATIFAYRVRNPGDYGVVEFSPNGRVRSLEEKPVKPRSDWAVPGLYIYGSGAPQRARTLAHSTRGELEITDLNRLYLTEGKLRAIAMGRGTAWLDTGTPENLLEASNFVRSIEARQGLFVGSPEEAAFRMGYLDREGLLACADLAPRGSDYHSWLTRIAHEEVG